MMALERPPASVRERLLAAAAREHATRPGTWGRRLALAGALSALWLSGAALLLGMRRDWPDLPAGSVTVTLAALLVVAVLASAAGLARGRVMVGAATEFLSPAVWGSLAVLVVLVLAVTPLGPSTSRFPGFDATVAHAPGCGWLTIAIALPLIVFGASLPRGLTLARPILAGACLGLGAATWAHAVVWLHCSVGGSGHALLGHLLPALPLMAISAWAMWMLDRRSRTAR